MPSLEFQVHRGAKETITEQIAEALRSAIREGRLAADARLPSWRDLAAQLGVARGTVRLAYERLIDEQLIVSSGAAGTHVARRPATAARANTGPDGFFEDSFAAYPRPAGSFQMGIPAQDAFPVKAWSRIVARAARAAADAPLVYPDPRGETGLRTEIAACLAVARGFACTPSQIFITGGFASALAFAVRTLQLSGSSCWTEEPGYPIARRVLVESGVEPVAVTVDAEGLDVREGIAKAPQASMAIVTAGQQAPLGATLSPSRRHALLDWASGTGAWIVEDDYLSELQLHGRAEPALASLDRDGRVLHIGTFSKTISPSLRLGFLVVPPALVTRFTRGVATTALAPAPLIQHAVGEFLRDGHYLRHLRRMKRLYALRRDALAAGLNALSMQHVAAGLAVLLRLPPGLSDVEVARAAHAQGLAPTALSLWYAQPRPEHGGLLLGVTNLREEEVAESCARLRNVIAQLELRLAASPSSRPPA